MTKTTILLLVLLLGACANGGGTMPTEQSTITITGSSDVSITIHGGPQTAGPGGPGGTVTMPIMIPVQVGPGGGLPTP